MTKLEWRGGGKFPARREFFNGIAVFMLKQHPFWVNSRIAAGNFAGAAQGILRAELGIFGCRAGNFRGHQVIHSSCLNSNNC